MKLKTMYNRYKRNKDIGDFLDDAQIYEEDNYTAEYYDELGQEESSVLLSFSSYMEDETVLFSISVFDKEEQYHYIFDDIYFAFARYLELLNKFDNAYTISEKKCVLAWDFILNKQPLFEEFEKD
jgi:hypothetical protein